MSSKKARLDSSTAPEHVKAFRRLEAAREDLAAEKRINKVFFAASTVCAASVAFSIFCAFTFSGYFVFLAAVMGIATLITAIIGLIGVIDTKQHFADVRDAQWAYEDALNMHTLPKD